MDYISTMKLMEETDVSVQIYTCTCSFLEVTAVHYGEKLNKDRQICGIHDIKKKHLCLTVQLNQSASGPMDCTIYVPEIFKPFPSKVNTQCTQRH